MRKYTIQDVIASLENALEVSSASDAPEKITWAIKVIIGKLKEGK